jgi:hydrogenase maturation factor
MCLDLLGQVVAREGDSASVVINGRRVMASTLLLPDLAVGDWVRVITGVAVEKVDPRVAANINSVIEQAKGAMQ